MRDFTVVLAHNRPHLLGQVVEAADEQCDVVLVLDNASDPPITPDWNAQAMILRDKTQPANLSYLWNRALNYIEGTLPHFNQWNVALICDDVVLPDGWWHAVRSGMRAYGASAASTHPYGHLTMPLMLRELDNQPMKRMCPWAFMLPGEQGIRANEKLRWWYCDTHLDWMARLRGGTLLVPGPPAPNAQENYWTFRSPELTAQVYLDERMFHQLWGRHL